MHARPNSAAVVLKLTDVQAFYGKSHVLHGVSLTVAPGEIVALLGRNGSGRSTTARAIMGLVVCQGSIQWKNAEMIGKPAYQLAQMGLGYVPESRDVFPALTVQQNLLLGQKTSRPADGWSFEDMYALFPRLRERQHIAAGVLSGGEQQMLTLCRTLMGAPELLIIDEPTEGLAPQMVERVAECLLTLKQRGIGVLLIEQKLSIAMAVSDRALVMGHGRIVFDGTPASLQADAQTRQQWLEI